jgi:hypothetical protein
MPLMTPCPGKRSILLMDNCRIHQKPAIYALCAAKGVLCFFLPPYSGDFSPIELMFNAMKRKMQSRYGAGLFFDVKKAFEECLWAAVTPATACGMFEHCFFEVTAEERA